MVTLYPKLRNLASQKRLFWAQTKNYITKTWHHYCNSTFVTKYVFTGVVVNILEATDKISQISSKKFGVQISFVRINIDTEKDEVISRNMGAQFVISNPDVLLPVYVQSELFGIIRIHGGAILDAISLNNVQEFAECTLKEFIIKEETLRRTKILESSLEAQKISKNVVPLGKRWTASVIPFQSAFKDVPTTPTVSHVGLLNGKAPKAHKLAVDLHDMFDRNGFLPFLELNFETASFSEEILTLGRSTLFVSEITKLSNDQQVLIAQYLKQYHLFKSPLFIFASEFSFEQLKAGNQIIEELFELVAHNSIDISIIEFATKSELKDYFQNLIGLN